MELLSRTCKTDAMNAERIIARVFVIIGALFWFFMFFGASTSARWAIMKYTLDDVVGAVGSAVVPLVLSIGVFILGMFYERLTALVLVLATGGVVVWGLLEGWETGVWMTVLTFLAAPMVIAALLYWLAGRMEQICLLEDKARL